jgi:serine-type D-Ala-D-Ala carboxypeptidase/endopeptidase (penicillin-binding protein 4)
MKAGHSLRRLFQPNPFIIGAMAFCLVAIRATAAETSGVQSLPELQQKIATFLAEPRFDGALWGIKVISLDTGKTLFETNAERLMGPASNCKLYTGALALDTFGGDYRITNAIYATATPNRYGTIHGDLIVEGRGDPTLNARRFGTNFWDIFEPFVSALTNAGVHRVTGDLIADSSYFRGEPTGGSLTVDDFQNGECPYISALTINDGLAHVRVEPTTVGAPCKLTVLQPEADLMFSNCTTTVAAGGWHDINYCMPFGERVIYVFGQTPVGETNEDLDIPVLDPARWFAACLKDALAQHGIKVSGKVRGVAWPQSYVLNTNDVKIGEALSPPLREVVRIYMKPSQNLENDTVLADVGEATRTADTLPWRTSEDLGLAALHQFLDTNDLPVDEVQFDEGSGLSNNNLATANSFAALLQFMWHHREAQDFIDALPIAGVDGTLRRRFHGTAAEGNLHAKTGTLRWVNSLSGYVTTSAGEHLAFSLLLNRYVATPGYDNRDQLDAIAVMLANFSGGSMPSHETQVEEYAPEGQLLFAQLPSAPFPHPARANGHWNRDHTQFYDTPTHYMDNTVAIFIPKGFHESDKIDFLVHFHGWRHTVAGTLDQYKLIDQFAASGKNAILVVPQGPFNAPDSFDGKLEDTNGFANFMADVVATLKNSGDLAQPNFEIGTVILSGHSGGYEAMSSILNRGGLSDKIREVWLFDALYAGTENFVAWQKAQGGRLLDVYTDHGGTEYETADLKTYYQTNGVSFFDGEDTAATQDNLQMNKIVFLHTDLAHDDTVAKRQAFQHFLETSCLQNK